MDETIIRETLKTIPKSGMALHIQKVPVNRVAQMWSLVSPFLLDGLERGQVTRQDYTIDQAKALLCRGDWQLIVAHDDTGAIYGACAVEFIYRPNDCVAFIPTLGGRGIVCNENGEQFFQLLRECGATTLEVACRKSAARLFSTAGLTDKHMILEKAL